VRSVPHIAPVAACVQEIRVAREAGPELARVNLHMLSPLLITNGFVVLLIVWPSGGRKRRGVSWASASSREGPAPPDAGPGRPRTAHLFFA
jgi:hypothetical protein